MLIHGDNDFVPIQQGEEFFTALLRQDKRAEFVRYAGEGHTINNRANVLEMWKRIAAWLEETMPRHRTSPLPEAQLSGEEVNQKAEPKTKSKI